MNKDVNPTKITVLQYFDERWADKTREGKCAVFYGLRQVTGGAINNDKSVLLLETDHQKLLQYAPEMTLSVLWLDEGQS